MDKQHSAPSVNSVDTFKNPFLSDVTKKQAIKGHLKGQGDPINDLLKIHADLITAIRKDPQSDYLQLADKVGVSASTIKRHIQKLKKAGILHRIGSRKQGRWEVGQK